MGIKGTVHSSLPYISCHTAMCVLLCVAVWFSTGEMQYLHYQSMYGETILGLDNGVIECWFQIWCSFNIGHINISKNICKLETQNTHCKVTAIKTAVQGEMWSFVYSSPGVAKCVFILGHSVLNQLSFIFL